MRMLTSIPLALLSSVLALAGCSEDSNLNETPVETPGEDSTPGDSTTPESEPLDTTVENDTLVADTFVAETADTLVAETTDASISDSVLADTFVPDTFVPDTFVPDTFVPDTAPVDTCVVNACGGCNALTAAPGSSCGTCGGKYACSGTTAVVCSGSMPLNACGGCTALTAAPGSACGTCGGKYACSGTDAVSCAGSMPLNGCGACNTLAFPPGGTCGLCGTYTCVGMTSTTCTDTASTQTDLTYSAIPDNQTVYDNELAFAYPVRHKGQVVSVSLRVARYFVAFGPPPVPWTLTIEAVRGTPSAPGASLGTVTYTAASTPGLPTWSPTAATTPSTRTTFNIASTVTLNVNDPIFFRISRVSGNNYFLFWGANSGGPADVTTSNRASSTAPWTSVAFDPDIDVKLNGCF